MPYTISRGDFEELAEEALETLPEELRGYLDNITITVEDYPSTEDTRRLNKDVGLLLGLYSGVPYPRRGGFFEIPYPMPDRIVLFQKNIEEICSSERELAEQIRRTMVHEIGHYFGLSENDLRRLGA